MSNFDPKEFAQLLASSSTGDDTKKAIINNLDVISKDLLEKVYISLKNENKIFEDLERNLKDLIEAQGRQWDRIAEQQSEISDQVIGDMAQEMVDEGRAEELKKDLSS